MSESVAVMWDDAMVAYDFGRGHPLSPIRVRLTMDLAHQLGLLALDNVDVVQPAQASPAELGLVHSAEYINAVTACSEPGAECQFEFGLGTDDNPLFANMHEATALIAGATLEAARTVWSGEHDHAINIAGGFHHAMADSASGFCVYNDLALGISWLLANGAKKVVYIDVDVHHGDGVERIFWDDPRVMTISLHESGVTQFPGTGWASDTGGAGAEGTAVNCALPAGAGDAQWLRALDAIVPPLLAAFAPDVVISQHGCDGHHADPLGHMNLSIDGQTAMAQRIHQWVHKFTKGKWVVTGGGGYAIVDVVPRAWTQLIAEVCGHGLSTDTELPALWRSETEALTGITAPVTAGENAACSTYSWVSDRRADDATDQAIEQTRTAVFPHFGLDPDSAQ